MGNIVNKNGEQMQTAIIQISKARRALEVAKDLPGVLEIRDKAEAIRIYVKASGDACGVINAASEIKLRAERKAGDLLAKMEKHDGDPRSHAVTRLSDVGITKMQSSRWQKESSVDDDRFDEWVLATNDAGEELTQSGLLRIATTGRLDAYSGEIEWYTLGIP